MTSNTDPRGCAFSRIQAQANEAAPGPNNLPHPTPAQAEARNYKLGRTSVHGLKVAIENPRGSIRSGTSANGKAWSNRMAAHYGEFTGTRGADGDAVDVFVGDFPESTAVWVINQKDAKGGFDEHKVMLGFQTLAQARDAYRFSFDRDWRGLGTIVPATLSQLKWWLRHGDMKRALTEDQLPHPDPDEGKPIMDRVLWNPDATPAYTTLDRALYAIRAHDGASGLVFDAVTMADIMSDPDITGRIELDALVVETGRMQQKMDQVLRVMQAAAHTVKPVDLVISDPIKARGVMQVAVLFNMDDGQTITVWFHNPDTTPAKLTPMDELISWKWMLNKKDVTIVVAPEFGRDLNVREVARRIMKLVEKNSLGFKRANGAATERAAVIEGLKGEITALQAESVELDAKLAKAQDDAVERERVAALPVEPAVPAWRKMADEELGSEEGYAAVEAAGEEALLYHQDFYDHLFQGRYIDIRNALRELGWDGPNFGELTKDGYALEPHFKQVGAGRNIVGMHFTIKGATGFYMSETLGRTAQEMASAIDLGVTSRSSAAPGLPAADPAAEPAAEPAAATAAEPAEPVEPPAVERIAIAGDEFGVFADDREGLSGLRAVAKAAYEAVMGSMVPCPALGADVELRRSGLNKVLSMSADPRKLKILAKIKEIIGSGKKLGTRPPYNPATDASARAYHTLRAEIDLAGEPLAVRLVVKEDVNGTFHYDHTVHASDALFDDAKANGPAQADPSTTSSSNGQGADPSDIAAGVRGDIVVDDASGVNLTQIVNLFIEGESSEAAPADDVEQPADTGTVASEGESELAGLDLATWEGWSAGVERLLSLEGEYEEADGMILARTQSLKKAFAAGKTVREGFGLAQGEITDPDDLAYPRMSRLASDLTPVLRRDGFDAYNAALAKMAAEEGLNADQELALGKLVEERVGAEAMNLAREKSQDQGAGGAVEPAAEGADAGGVPGDAGDAVGSQAWEDKVRAAARAGSTITGIRYNTSLPKEEREGMPVASLEGPGGENLFLHTLEDVERARAVMDDELAFHFVEFDPSIVKMPSAAQLGLTKSANWLVLADAPGWSNGHIVDLMTRPPVVQKAADKLGGIDHIGRRVTPDSFDRIVSGAVRSATVPVTPVGMSPNGKVVVLASDDGRAVSRVSAFYYSYFAKAHKGATFYGNPDDTPMPTALAIKKGGEAVGILQPLNDRDRNRTLASVKRGRAPAEPVGEPAASLSPADQVDAAYKFDQATDRFKEYIAETVADPDYSMFATAKAMDQAAMALGATISWDVEEAVLDAVSDEAAPPSLFDSVEPDGEEVDGDAEFDACPVVDEDDGAVMDGDFKGHPFRGNQHKKASRQSHAAVSASISAKRAEKDGDHKGAKSAHKSAHYSHMAAMEGTTGQARKYHKTMAKFHGSRAGVTMDAVDDEVLDAVGGATLAVVGRIHQGGELKGRAVVAGDGKAMIYTGDSGTERVSARSDVDGEARSAVWSDADAARMVGWLLGGSGDGGGPGGGKKTYEQAKADVAAADARVAKASEVLNTYPKGPTGLTPDEVKASAEWKAAMAEYNTAFEELREANDFMGKNYKAQRSADRQAEREAKLAKAKQADGGAWDKPLVSEEGLRALTEGRGLSADVTMDVDYAGGKAVAAATLGKGDVRASLEWKSGSQSYALRSIGDVDGEFDGNHVVLSKLLDSFVAWVDQKTEKSKPKRVTIKEARDAVDVLQYSVSDLQGHMNAEFLRADVLGRLEPKMTRIKALMKSGWPESVYDPSSLLATAQGLIDRHASLREEGLTKDMGRSEAWGYLTHDKKLSPERVEQILAVPSSIERSGGLINTEIPTYTMAYLNSEADKQESAPVDQTASQTPDQFANKGLSEAGLASAQDRMYLQSIISGTADLLDPGLADKLEPLFAKYEQDSEMMGLLNQAAETYGKAVETAALAALKG